MLPGYEKFFEMVLTQLFENRENHEDSKDRDIDYMFKIGSEQYGQLGKALADGDIETAIKKIGHTTAILYELFHRLEGVLNENRESTDTGDRPVQERDNSQT